MLGAFSGTHVANARASLAHGAGRCATAHHEPGRDPAQLGAVDIERDALRHHFDVVFLQTRHSAHIAGVGAVVTRLNAG